MPEGKREPHWAITGLIWGALMFILMALVYPWVTDEAITVRGILISIPLWALAGLGYGRTMHWWNKRSAARKMASEGADTDLG